MFPAFLINPTFAIPGCAGAEIGSIVHYFQQFALFYELAIREKHHGRHLHGKRVGEGGGGGDWVINVFGAGHKVGLLCPPTAKS